MILKHKFIARFISIIALLYLFVFGLDSESKYVLWHSIISYILLLVAMFLELYSCYKNKNHIRSNKDNRD